MVSRIRLERSWRSSWQLDFLTTCYEEICMAMILTSVHIVNRPGLVLFFVLWLVLFACAHLLEVVMIVIGVVLTSTLDFMNALRDLRYPLWGEARILRSMQLLRTTWASIHFTPFGLSYLRDRFGSSPTDLLQVL